MLAQAGSGAHHASLPSHGCTSTSLRSRTALWRRSMRCLKPDCRRGSSGSTFVLDDMWWRRMRRVCGAGRVVVIRLWWRGRRLLVLRRRVDLFSVGILVIPDGYAEMYTCLQASIEAEHRIATTDVQPDHRTTILFLTLRSQEPKSSYSNTNLNCLFIHTSPSALPLASKTNPSSNR
jgi:hypothetical protein